MQQNISKKILNEHLIFLIYAIKKKSEINCNLLTEDKHISIKMRMRKISESLHVEQLLIARNEIFFCPAFKSSHNFKTVYDVRVYKVC